MRAAESAASSSFQVLPTSIELTGSEARSGILVQQSRGITVLGPIENFNVKVEDESIARFEAGHLLPVSDGETRLRVEVPGHESQWIPVKVANVAGEVHWEFDAHVQSVLSRAGCNSGACHGALAGKGGFRLSLRAYDSRADHFTVTRQDRGRRIEPAAPGRSLLLAKPSGAIRHKGGLRLDPESTDYKLLADWIADGAPGPQAEDAKLVAVEVLPKAMELRAGTKQRLLVQARYADGRVEDVTRWAKFSSSNEVVAEVDEDGNVSVIGNGKGAIVAWFASRLAISSIISPYKASASEVAYQDFKPVNVIDEVLLDEWKALQLAPSPMCTDETFIRPSLS